ncbi:MAG: hypothetical protein J7604_00445 [Sporocytophaga sp.]|uniref:hypothetical protein n=1 Tax=Sporocytophaga sp. TaxID=2231183 RepID=UPI001B0000C9|nr:hypothetical protein [Sporocytophaga sp.]MBO9698638.1 hypothetical protein [Sporocytophaga sp.]
MVKKISIDIDGIFNDYPHCWVRFINLAIGANFQAKEDARNSLGEQEYERLKSLYRTSEYKANLEVSDEARSFCDHLTNKGYEIIIATSRPLKSPKYPGLYDLTYNWLKKNDVPFSSLIYKERTDAFLKEVEGVSYHIEDEIEYADFFARNGITTFLYEKSRKVGKAELENIIVFESFKELESYID